MNSSSFNIEEFIRQKDEIEEPVVEESAESEAAAETEIDVEENLDVQKAVVESLAADKAALDCEINSLKAIISEKEELVSAQKLELDKIKADFCVIKEQFSAKLSEIEDLKRAIESKDKELADFHERQFEVQERNPNSLALLDRDVELPDRFPGETRDHVLEVIKEARDKAESDGRIRKAQILESVLVNNDFNGNLSTRRKDLEQLFIDNGNIINGKVIEELIKLGISHKNGEDYLLPSEILTRNY